LIVDRPGVQRFGADSSIGSVGRRQFVASEGALVARIASPRGDLWYRARRTTGVDVGTVLSFTE